MSKVLYIYMVGGVCVQLLGSQGTLARAILILRECIWNVLTVSLVLPAFSSTPGGLSSWFHPG